MNQPTFALRMGLRPGDAVVVPKSAWNVVEHYLIYWDNFNGHDYYLENNNEVGVRWINEALFLYENLTFKRIRYFQGSDNARNIAIRRATSLLGNRYDLAKFNCENYANYVQTGKSYSQQVNNTVLSSVGLGLLLLLL